MNMTAVKELIESPETHAIVLSTVLTHQFGEEWYDWDPSTIYLELREEFGADAKPEVMDRISAVQVIMLSDAFFKRFDAFSNVANTLSSGSPSFTTLDPLTSAEAAWALAQVAFMRDMLNFSYSIKAALRRILGIDGIDTSDAPSIFNYIFEEDNISSKGMIDVVQDVYTGESDILDEYIDNQIDEVMSQYERAELSSYFEKMLTDIERKDIVEID